MLILYLRTLPVAFGCPCCRWAEQDRVGHRQLEEQTDRELAVPRAPGGSDL